MLQAIIATMGGLGLFLIGMAVMTDGLKAAAGSTLRAVLARAAATPLSGTFWGAFVTLLVQSSSATTMTTIGLVSSGLLTFSQGLTLVFGANIGTTGTAWIVALFGVRFSLTAVAMPMICLGALARLLGKGRWAAAGSALAGFGLLFLGLTTLQQGMGGISEMVNPADLPGVIGGEGVGIIAGIGGLLLLVIVGILFTTVMQSSSAAIAVTLSALYAGAIGPDQAVALVIGQNIGTTTSALLAAIGATTPARRTAAAHVGFNIVTGSIAILLFPLIAPAILFASKHADPPILIAIFHTAYKLTGVAILLPNINRYARLLERIVPERGPAYTRTLDRSVLGVPEVAVEAARRAVASVLHGVTHSVAHALESAAPDPPHTTTPPTKSPKRRVLNPAELEVADQALDEVRLFLSAVAEPPSGDAERQRMASTVHALDHAARLIESLREEPNFRIIDGADDARARELCAQAMEIAERVGFLIASSSGQLPLHAADTPAADGPAQPDAKPDAEPDAEPDLESSDPVFQARRLSAMAHDLAELRRAHRSATLRAAGTGEIKAADAMVRVETVRRLDRIVYHAWRAASHLVGIVEDPQATQTPHEDDANAAKDIDIAAGSALPEPTGKHE